MDEYESNYFSDHPDYTTMIQKALDKKNIDNDPDYYLWIKYIPYWLREQVLNEARLFISEMSKNIFSITIQNCITREAIQENIPNIQKKIIKKIHIEKMPSQETKVSIVFSKALETEDRIILNNLFQ